MTPAIHTNGPTIAPPLEVVDGQRGLLAKRADRLLKQARDFSVTNAEDFEMASAALQSIVTSQREVGELLDPICKATHAAWNLATSKRKEILDPLQEAERLMKGKAIFWQQEQERVRRAEQARLQAEEDAKHEAALIEQAAEAKAAGATEAEVAAAVEQAPPPAPVYVAPATPRIAGISTRENWKAQIENPLVFCKAQLAAADGGILAHPKVIEAMNGVLTGLAKVQKGTLRVAGVRVWDAGTMAVSSK